MCLITSGLCSVEDWTQDFLCNGSCLAGSSTKDTRGWLFFSLEAPRAAVCMHWLLPLGTPLGSWLHDPLLCTESDLHRASALYLHLSHTCVDVLKLPASTCQNKTKQKTPTEESCPVWNYRKVSLDHRAGLVIRMEGRVLLPHWLTENLTAQSSILRSIFPTQQLEVYTTF